MTLKVIEKLNVPVTTFWDMHSGGGLKEKWHMIFIEAPQAEAEVIFYNRFGHNPNRVTCTCCGNDYSISEDEDLLQATGYHRGCAYDKESQKYVEAENTSDGWHHEYVPLNEYLAREDVLLIRRDEIKPEEREGEVPEQGYVWVD